MLDTTLGRQLQVNMGTDANRHNDLLIFMPNAILKTASKYLGLESLRNSMCQG